MVELVEKTLRNKETVVIGQNKYVLSSLPAFTAQKMLIQAFDAFQKGSIAALPDNILMELVSWTAIINANGAEVQLMNEDIVNTMIADPYELMDLEARMVEKNFGFLADGKLQKVLERLGKALTKSLPSDSPDTRT